MLITQLVTANAHRLTPVDRRIAAALQADPGRAAFARAVDITSPLDLHESSATRFAQRLGFSGYPELREALREDYLAGDGPAQRVRSRLERADGDVLAAFVEDEVAALQALPLHVSQAELDALAADVVGAGTVYLFAQGNAVVLAEQLGRRLTRFGIRVTSLTGSIRDIAERLANAGPDDLFLAFAFRRTPAPLPRLITVCDRVGTATVLITDTLLTLLPRPGRTLAAPRGHGREFLSLTVPMALSNALVLTIARHAPDTALHRLERLESILEHLDP